MIRTLIVTVALALGAACTCSNNDLAESAAPPSANAAGKKSAKAPKTKRPDGERIPVLRNGRFKIPLKTLDDSTLERVRDAINAAQTTIKRDEDELLELTTKPWKCRRTKVWKLEGPSDAEDIRLHERLDTPSCVPEQPTVEKWEVNLRVPSAERPKDKSTGGKLPFVFAGEQRNYSGDAWTKSYATSYTVTGGRGGGPFTNGEDWITERLPGGHTLGKKAELDGHRWSMAVAMVAGEKVTVEGEAWTCRGKEDVVSAELIFRTNKRAAGHTPNTPKDVVVTEKARAFAAELVKELGDLVGGEGNSTEAAMTCAKG